MMPKWASSKSGVHCVSVRKLQSETCLKNWTDSLTRTYTMPTVTKTETDAAAKRMNSIAFSPTIRLRRWARRAVVSPSAVTLVEAEPLGATADIVIVSPGV